MRGVVLKLIVWLSLHFCSIVQLKGQELKTQVADKREFLFQHLKEFVEADLEDPDFLEEISLFFENLIEGKVLCSREGVEQLRHYHIIDEWEQLSIIRKIETANEQLTPKTFLQIEGVDSTKLILLSSLLSFNREKSRPLPQNATILRAIVTPQKREGYSPITAQRYIQNPESRYLGNSWHLYMQNRVNLPGSLSLIITSEKDPGERTLDYFSFSLSFKREATVSTHYILGSYTVRAGEGLTLWNGFSMSSYFDPLSAPKSEFLPTLYGSTDENRAFKGGVFTISKNSLRATVLLSYRGLDANLKDDGYSSLLTTGLHNTPKTVRSKGALKRAIIASNITYNGVRWRVGLITLYANESLAYSGSNSDHLKTAQLNGNSRANLSIYWRKMAGTKLWYGEAALDICGRVALLTGLNWRFKDGSSLLLTTNYRDRGFSAVASTLTFKGVDTPSYSAVYKRRLKQYRLLSAGVEGVGKSGALFCKNSFQLFKKIDIDWLTTFSLERALIRFDLRHPIGSNFTHHMRIQSASSKQDVWYLGYNLHCELLYKNRAFPIEGSFRVAFFNTPVWSVRLYSYERDILTQIKSSLLYGKGVRWYLNLRGRITNNLDIWLKYGQFNYLDRSTIGQQKELINGNRKGEFKVELRIKPALS